MTYITTDCKERISNDPNGNILTCQRNADATSNYPKFNDIRIGQLDNNNVYDAIGNLIQVVKDTITNITWNV